MSASVEQVSDGFVRAFGRPPEGVWAAPGRANLIGEFTDYNEGFVLPFALPWVARAAIARREDDLVRAVSAQRSVDTDGAGESALEPGASRLGDLVPGSGRGWASYVFGVVWALGQADGARLQGADVFVDSDVPIGAGLSSSAALECSVALALAELSGAVADRRLLARLAQRAENEYVGVPTGIMDQTASLCCEAGHALFLDTRSGAMRQVPLALELDGLVLLVVNTGVRHALTSSAYAERRADCLQAAEQMTLRSLRDIEPDRLEAALERVASERLRRRARHVVSENRRVLEVVELLESGRPGEIGPLLTAGHRSLQRDFEVSTAELDTVVEVALENGALGARMTGGGFGGAVLVLAAGADAGPVSEALDDAFSRRGWARPATTPVVACAGAARLA